MGRFGCNVSDGEWWGAADGTLHTRPPLTSCCVAKFQTARGWYQSGAQRLGTPGLQEAAIPSRKMKFKSFCIIITIIIIIRFDGPGVRITYLVLPQLVGKLSIVLAPESACVEGKWPSPSVLVFSSVKWDYSSHLRCLLLELCASVFRSAFGPVSIALSTIAFISFQDLTALIRVWELPAGPGSVMWVPALASANRDIRVFIFFT